ncbi:hypothetical protein BpHYR1_047119 [Brachionus plicatilis]|uniref:Uncharacterized protein n=1 Tax=Brachionus plicatilis TaxID=10195 RepID=A0A3M7PLY0_BRAPC|nr:hypothetical protein BpHYR1_047119 [Brachionus plicatilis]
MVHDIMVHGVPNLDDAAVKLREELDQFEDLFGEIQWVRMGQKRRFHRTNYAFVRYRDSSVHPQVVRHFNDQSRTQTSGSKLIRGPPKHIMCYKTYPQPLEWRDSLPKWIGSVRNLRFT